MFIQLTNQLNEQGEHRVWNDHTVLEDPEWGLGPPSVGPQNRKRPHEPRLCYMMTADSSTSHGEVPYITWWSTVHHMVMLCTSRRDVLTNILCCCCTWHDYVLNITCWWRTDKFYCQVCAWVTRLTEQWRWRDSAKLLFQNYRGLIRPDGWEKPINTSALFYSHGSNGGFCWCFRHRKPHMVEDLSGRTCDWLQRARDHPKWWEIRDGTFAIYLSSQMQANSMN